MSLIKHVISTGTVVKCPDPRHALVEFEDKEQVLTPTRLMIATSGAIARPHLRVGTDHKLRLSLSLSPSPQKGGSVIINFENNKILQSLYNT